jgi:hypothetical protein
MRREQGIAAAVAPIKARRPIEVCKEAGAGDKILAANPFQRAEARSEIQPRDRRPGWHAYSDHAARPKRCRAEPESAGFSDRSNRALDDQISRNHKKQIDADAQRWRRKRLRER